MWMTRVDAAGATLTQASPSAQPLQRRQEDRSMSHSGNPEIENAYRAKSAEARGLAAGMSGDNRDTLLDVAEHWETLAKQAETLARSKRLISDWERGKAATGPGSIALS
jgi:hypothetical protein